MVSEDPAGDGGAAGEMVQRAPFPVALEELIAEVSYKPGWKFRLQRDRDLGAGCSGLTLLIVARTYDSDQLPRTQRAEALPPRHLFQSPIPVPPEVYDRAGWAEWLFARIVDIEVHEVTEFLRVGGVRVAQLYHARDRSPYVVRWGQLDG